MNGLASTEIGARAALQPARCKTGADIMPWLSYFLAGKRVLPSEACFFLRVHDLEREADEDFGNRGEGKAILDQQIKIRESYGLTAYDDGWPTPEDTPPEYRALDREFDEKSTLHLAALLRKRGLTMEADLLLSDREEYRRRLNAGRAFFMEPSADPVNDFPES